MDFRRFQIDYFPCATGRFVIGNLTFMNSGVVLASGQNGQGQSKESRYGIEVTFNFGQEIFTNNSKAGLEEPVIFHVKHAADVLIAELKVIKGTSTASKRIKITMRSHGLMVAQSTLVVTPGCSSGIVIDLEGQPVEINFLIIDAT